MKILDTNLNIRFYCVIVVNYSDNNQMGRRRERQLRQIQINGKSVDYTIMRNKSMLNMVTQWNKQCILKKITTTKNKEILLEINEL